MNYSQTFDEFASSLGPTDIALYAGAAIIAWVLFKDRLNPVTSVVSKFLENLRQQTVAKTPVTDSAKETVNNSVKPDPNPVIDDVQDVFFQLVSSWKKTRDLAVLAGCVEAVKAADAMFPYLSPNICNEENV